MRRFRKTITPAIAGLGALVLLSNPGLGAGDNATEGEATRVQLAHMGQGQGGGRGGQPCPMGVMGPGMRGQGMMGPGMGSQSMMGPGMGGQGMMGPGMMGPGMGGHGMMGRGFGMGHGFGTRVVPMRHLTVDDVRHFLEHRLAWRGNKRLKLGEVKEADEETIIAEIVTVDGSLVQRFKIDRHTGRMKQVD